MISLLVIACNESARLRGCIESARPVVDEVVVIVQQSTDDTLGKAKQLADRTIEHPRHGFCEASRLEGLAACSGDWVLSLDADERLTPEGAALLPFLTSSGGDFFNLRRFTRVGGTTIEDAPHARFFRRDLATARPELHTQFEPKPGAVVETIEHVVMIAHEKTWEEQNLDDQRYAVIGGVK